MAKGHEPIKIDQNPLIFSRFQPINEPTVFQTVVVQFDKFFLKNIFRIGNDIVVIIHLDYLRPKATHSPC